MKIFKLTKRDQAVFDFDLRSLNTKNSKKQFYQKNLKMFDQEENRC